MLDTTGAEVRALSTARRASLEEAPDVLVLTEAHRVQSESGSFWAPPLSATGDRAGGRGDLAEVLDEEALRSFIRSAVRRELEGAFGESLTRRIKGYVRREVLRLITGRATA